VSEFEVLSTSKLVFGVGAVSKVSEIVAGLCRKGDKVMLLTDRNIAKTGVPDRIAMALSEEGFRVETIDALPAEPTDAELDAFAVKVRGIGTAVMVAVGGGSVIDATKILSVLAVNGMATTRLVDVGVPCKGIPFVAVPTTAGTGAEATPNAIVLFPERDLKIGIVSPHFIPDRVILDPSLLVGLPQPLTASTGIDAICHLLECYIGRKANPFSDMCALEGLRLMADGLPKAFTSGSDLEARSKTMFAAYLGGTCIASSGTNVVHALSYPLGGTFRIPHGVANAILLVPSMELIAESAPDRLALAAKALGLGDEGGSAAGAAALVGYLKHLVDGLGIPKNLEKYNVMVEDMDALVEAAFGVRRLLDNSPVQLKKDDIRTIYRKVI
jgi:alcohol dehydrogenase class IV